MEQQTTEQQTTRKCNKCKIEKSLEEFARSSRRLLGVRYTCKACISIARKKSTIHTRDIASMIGSRIPNTNLTLISDLGTRKEGKKYRRHLSVKCDCGIIKEMSIKRITDSKSCNSPECIYSSKSVQALESIIFKNNETGFFIKSSVWEDLRRGARERSIKFNLKLDDVSDQYKNQNGRCFLTGIKLDTGEETKSSNNRTWSIDRVDSDLGYERHNIVFVHKFANILKNKFDNETLVQVANAIARIHPRNSIEDEELSNLMTEALKTSSNKNEIL